MTQNDISSRDVLDFWFGPRDEHDQPSTERILLWFSPSGRVIKMLDERFRSSVIDAHEGRLDHWAQEPHESLALILLLSVFADLIFTHELLSYECQQKALKVCEAGLNKEDDHQLSLIERAFFYRPLQTCEELDVQLQSVVLYQELAEIALQGTENLYEGFLKSALDHHNVIKKFKRFPWWNKALNRAMTLEEQHYLDSHPI